MSEANIIMLNMRGGCATVGGKVHTLFRVNNRRPRQADTAEQILRAVTPMSSSLPCPDISPPHAHGIVD